MIGHRYRVNEDVREVSQEGDLLLLHLSSAEYFSFRGSGRTLWNGIRAGMSEGEMAYQLVAAHAAEHLDPLAVTADVRAFCAGLLAAGIVTPIDDSDDKEDASCGC